jgi:hypothetical protein
MSALGQKQTCAAHQLMSASPPIATVKANFPHKVMSADMCGARAYVCFGPKADMVRLFSVKCARGRSLGRDLKAFSDEPPAFQACLIVVCAFVGPLGQFDLRRVNFFVRNDAQDV